MRRFFKRENYPLNRIMILLTLFYIISMAVMYFFRTAPYQYNPSSLVGLWIGFAGANSALVPDKAVIFSDGGYDGQFFFLNAAYLFSPDVGSPPITDSFLIRYTRIGFSLLCGFASSSAGWENYAVASVLILNLFHLLSFACLYRILPEKNKVLSLLYLFSPFSANSNLLLVSDSLLSSFFIFTVYFLERSGTKIFTLQDELTSVTGYSRRNLIPVFFVSVLFFLFIKETAAVYAVLFLIISLIQKRAGEGAVLAVSLLIYSLFLIYIHFYMKFYPGTYPLSFLQLTDFPLLGFLKSIKTENLVGLKPFLREVSKFPLFILLILLLCFPFCSGKNLSSPKGRFVSAMLIISSAPALIAEQGYWLTFDNISRFFTLSIPVYIFSVPVSEERKIRFHAGAVSGIIFFLFFSLILRTVWIKAPMEFFVRQKTVQHSGR